jgi:hypothetical protein
MQKARSEWTSDRAFWAGAPAGTRTQNPLSSVMHTPLSLDVLTPEIRDSARLGSLKNALNSTSNGGSTEPGRARYAQ